jgi:hypothetical protein
MKLKIVPKGSGFVIVRFTGWDTPASGFMDDKIYLTRTDAAEAIRRKRKENKYGKPKRY